VNMSLPMPSRDAVILVALLGAAMEVPAALAAGQPCRPVAISATAEVPSRWPGLLDSVRNNLTARDDIDTCARVVLSESNTAVAIVVSLPDGRVAARTVGQREDVIPTLEALLLVPARDQEVVDDSAAAAPLPVRPQAPASASLSSASSGAGSDAASQRSPVRVELSVATGGRFGDGQAGIGFGALSFIEVVGWLAGFEARVDGYQHLADHAGTGAFELGLLAGRRFRFGTRSLDVLAGGALALQGGTKSVKQVGAPDDTAVTTSSSRMDPRLRLGARLHFRALSTLRPFIALDGELGQSRSAADSQSDIAPLPNWTVGVALGATVGTR